MKKWWKNNTEKQIISEKISEITLGRRKTTDFEDVFKNKYKKHNCWNFTGSTTNDGYGQIWYQGKIHRTHRLSYILSFGDIKDNSMFVYHKCNNRLCINPDHLILGSRHNNMIYKLSKNKYSEDIKKQYNEGKTRIELRKIYGLSKAIIDYILDHN